MLELHTSAIDGGASLPTPTASRYGRNKSRSEGAAERLSLDAMASRDMWPTPTVHGNHNAPRPGTKSGTGLSTAVKMWQTPVADDAANRKKGKWNSRGEPKLSAQAKLYPGHSTQPTEPGPLNPAWVEWLMGWPIGWTDLRPLEMDKYRQWLRSHGRALAALCEVAS